MTTTGTLGRLAAVACGAVVAALLPAQTASAAPPLVETSTRVSVPGCELAVGDVTAFLSVFWVGEGRPSDSSLIVFQDGEPIASEDPELSSTLWDGSVLSGRFVLIDSGAEGTVGTAEFEMTVAPVGAATSETVRTRLGNSTERQTVTSQPFAVAGGTVTVDLGDPGDALVLDPAGCTGATTTTVTVTSQPDTTVNREAPDVRAVCEATNSDGDVLYLDLNSHGGPNVYLEVVTDGRLLVGYSPLDWSGPPHPVTTGFEVLEFVGEDVVVVGEGHLDLATTKTGHTSSTLVYQGGRDRVATTFFTASGTVIFPGLAPFTVSGCSGHVATAHDRTSTPAGPPPGGAAPANDSWTGATDLVLGTSGVNVQTGGAVMAPEVGFGCPGIDVGRTVWFRFTGTGGDVTLDPAGSSFNTVLAVYEMQNGGLTEVGCIDDAGFGTHNPTLQAPLTVATEEGGTYYVQVGGFAGQYGRLRLSAG